MRAMVTSVRAPLPSLAAPIACGCCMVAGLVYVAAVNPSDGGVFPPCPFRTITGWWCPGCGLTRATHQLLRGNVVQALHYNLFVFVVLGAILLSWISWLVTCTGRRVTFAERVPAWVYGIAGSAMLAFAVIRNLPGVDGLRG